MDIKIDNCPFCDGKCRVIISDHSSPSRESLRSGYCDHCQVEGPKRTSRLQAILAWNRRHADKNISTRLNEDREAVEEDTIKRAIQATAHINNTAVWESIKNMPRLHHIKH